MSTTDEVWLVAGGEPGAQRFGQMVQRLRKNRRMSVEELSVAAGLSVGTIRAVEQARRAPSEESGVRLLELLLPEGSLSTGAADDAVASGAHRPNISFADPETGAQVALEFRARKAGDNRRWSSDKPRAAETPAEARIREFLADPANRAQAVESGKRMAEVLIPAISAVKAIAARPGDDAAYGRVVRRLTPVNEFRLAYVYSLLELWERVDSGDADEREQNDVARVQAILREHQPLSADELEILNE